MTRTTVLKVNSYKHSDNNKQWVHGPIQSLPSHCVCFYFCIGLSIIIIIIIIIIISSSSKWCPVGCYTTYNSECLPTFRSNTLLPSSEWLDLVQMSAEVTATRNKFSHAANGAANSSARLDINLLSIQQWCTQSVGYNLHVQVILLERARQNKHLCHWIIWASSVPRFRNQGSPGFGSMRLPALPFCALTRGLLYHLEVTLEKGVAGWPELLSHTVSLSKTIWHSFSTTNCTFMTQKLVHVRTEIKL